MDAIFNRRSIRRYTSQPVSKEIIEDLLRAAMSAPSANNQQPWNFIIIDKREILDEIPKFHPYSQMLKEAQVAVLVCGDLDLDKTPGRWPLDCSAATQNLLLSIVDKGLGGVWVGIYPEEARIQGFKNLLKLPENIIPFSLVPIGHPAEQKPPADRFKPERIHYNQW